MEEEELNVTAGGESAAMGDEAKGKDGTETGLPAFMVEMDIEDEGENE